LDSLFFEIKFMLQKTISHTIEFSGKGLHTGNFCKVTLSPANENEGFVFLHNQKKYPISVNAVFDTTRSTNLKFDNYIIYTIEHLLSALMALQIDNIQIEVEENEIPILDGSAKLFVEKILDIGIKQEKGIKKIYIAKDVIEWQDDETKSEYTLIPNEHFEATCLIDYNYKILGKQYATLSKWQDYSTEIAPAKTFCFLHEIEFLYQSGLIKGGDLTNALVFSENTIDNKKAKWLSETFNQPIFSIPEKGLLNPLYQTFDNEAARHKLLDLIGDLALFGMPIQGKLIVSKPGHTSNIRFVKYLLENFAEKHFIL
jgi:UDP-3-O-[3-hydroxymyristoyl] N-acetylglucosamine deacetylase/3-hydroxyacyl-[acyl-carrier-protein] dehydratase